MSKSCESINIPFQFFRYLCSLVYDKWEQLQAYHPLTGEGNPIVYNIPRSADSGFFAIDTNSGVLHSLESFDYEEKKFYQFQVGADIFAESIH